MSDSPEQVWIIPSDPADLAPLPALIKDGRIAHYIRKPKEFGAFSLHDGLDCTWGSFEECRAAMIEVRMAAFKETREHARKLAASIEHIKIIPTASFPNVVREVPEAQQQQEGEGQEEAKAEEVKPAKPALRRPSRRN
jgi:hypothetical protein